MTMARAQGHALLLASGELAGISVGELLDAGEAERRRDPRGDLGAWPPAHAQTEADIAGHGHVGNRP